MNCWQRRRGTRTSVTSWIRPLLSWQDTEVPGFPSAISTSALHSLHCCLFAKHTVNLSIKQKKSLYNSSLLPVYFGVCVWSDQLTKTSKKIYELFFVVAYTCHLFVQREVCIERASFEPAKSCFWYYLDHRSPSHSCVSAGKVMTIEAGNIRMTGSFSYLNICYSFVSADVWKKKGLTSPFWFS